MTVEAGTRSSAEGAGRHDAERRDAFISYSHHDVEFALKLRDALVAAGQNVWLDESEIHGGTRWGEELERAIDGADAFLFLVSPDSAASTECGKELAHALELSKRILPVRVRETPLDRLPKGLTAYQFVPARELFDRDFQGSLAQLITEIETDREWLREHTDWNEKAREWQKHDSNAAYLLSGSELELAEQFRGRSAGKQPALSALQNEYIDASRRGATRRLRRTRAFVSVALVVAIALSVVALLQRQQAIDNQKQATSGRLSAESLLELNVDPQLSLLLAAQSAKTSETAAALDALRRALPANHLVRTFQADDRPLLGAQLASDGSLLLTESADGHARLWNVATGKLLHTFPTINYNAGQGGMFDPKGRELLIWFLGEVQIWNLSDLSAAPVTIRSSTFDQLETAVLSPDDNLVATASGPGITGASALWDAHTGRLVGFLSTGVNNGGVIAFSPNSELVATGSSNGVASIWDAHTGQLRHTLDVSVGQSGSLQDVPGVSFSPDGTRLLVSAGFPPFSNPGASVAPEESQIWNVANARRLAQVNGGDAVWSRGGGYIATTSSDGTARVWSASGSLISQLKSSYPTTGQAVFSPDVFNQDTQSYQIDRLATGSAVGFGAIWNAISGVQTATLAGDTGDVNPVAFMPSGTQLVSYSSDGAARLWDTASAPTTTLPEPPTPKNANPVEGYDSEPINFAAPVEGVTVSNPNELLILDTRTGATLATLPASAQHSYDDVSFDGQGRVMLVASSHLGRTLPAQLRLVHGAALLHTLPGSDGRSDQGIVSPNGELAATVGHNDSITVWDVSSGRRVAEFDRHVGHKVGSAPAQIVLDFSPDSRLLLSSDSSGATFVWDARTGQTVQAIHGPPEPPVGMYNGFGGAISPNDQLVATYASWDGTVHVYRIGTPSQLIGLQGVDTGIFGVAFNPDSTLLATTAEGDVDLWDTRAQSPVQTIPGNFGGSIAFAPDGRSVLVGQASSPTVSISCVVCGGFPQLLAAAKARETRGFTPQERALYLGG